MSFKHTITIGFIFSCLLILYTLVLLPASVSAQTVGKWGRHVISFTFINSYTEQQKFQLEFSGTFTHTSGTRIQNLPGYYDGNNTWKIGFMPTLTGDWTYVTSSTDPDLDGKTGTISVTSNAGHPGMLKADSNNLNKWKYSDGGYVVPIGLFASAMLDDATLTEFIAMADFMLQNNLQLINFRINESNRAFLNKSSASMQMDLTLWNRLEQRMDELGKRGLGINIMLYTDHGSKPAACSAEEQLLIRYTVARLAGYPIVQFNSGIDIKEFRDVNCGSERWVDWYGNFVKSLDPYDHPVSSRVFGGLIMDPSIRTYHSVGDRNSIMGSDSVGNGFLGAFDYDPTPYDMPAANNDNFSEDYNSLMVGNINRHLPEDIRRAGWKALIAGGVSFNVRHNTINTQINEDDRYFHIKNITTELHSEQWLSLVNPFVQTKLGVTFGEMVPDTSVVSGTGIFALADPAKTKLLYFLIGVNDLWNKGTGYGGPVTVNLTSISSSTNYTGVWFNTRTGAETSAGTFTGGSSYTKTPPSSTNDDWILLLSTTTPTVPTSTPTPAIECFDYQITLDSAQQSSTITSSATGKAAIRVNPGANTLSYTIIFSGLTSGETAAHIHGMAARAVDAGPLHTLSAGSPKISSWTYSDSQEQDILNGLTYVNIHTQTYPGGEIRGQVDNQSGNSKTTVDCASPLPTPTSAVPGDTNNDGSVNILDLSTLLSNFGISSGAGAEQGDTDNDKDVDISDLATLLSHFGSVN